MDTIDEYKAWLQTITEGQLKVEYDRCLNKACDAAGRFDDETEEHYFGKMKCIWAEEERRKNDAKTRVS
jgi:hypothetical protein